MHQPMALVLRKPSMPAMAITDTSIQNEKSKP
jgi:hypothetical protein